MYSTEDVIHLLESANGIALSEEQKAVLRSPDDKALLINAAAGAGKTTIVIMTMLKRILTGEINSEDILAITFSRQAQIDMADRYDQYVDKLRILGVNMPVEKPHFSTFHAFFYRILRQLPEYASKSVISNYQQYQFAMSDAITHSSDQVLSKSEILDNIFNTYQFLLNTNQSVDGTHLIHSDYDDEDEEVLDVSQLYMAQPDILNNIVHEDSGINFWQDYVAVIETYDDLKTKNNQIDFNDMTTMLSRALDNPFDASQLTTASSLYELLIIDEFQDINNAQWELIQRLLLPEVIDKMIAIGDNDQAIYGFRGSTPKFIMEFDKILENSVTLNLSTNYRTGGIILNEAKKVIEDNQYRLPKQLLAFKKDTGEVIIHKNTLSQFSQASPFLQDLLQNVKNPTDDNKVAVLMRYNSDAMLVIDWLARNGVYVETPNHLVLSKNKLYSKFMTMAYAFYTDNLSIFQQVSRIVGFKTLESNISEAIQTSGISKISDLPNVLLSRLDIDERQQKHISNIQNLLDIIAQTDDDEPAPLGEFFQLLMSATAAYYNYMLKQKYISEEIYTKIINYMYQLFLSGTDKDLTFNQFFEAEQEKNQLVESPTVNVKNIVISSMHQSKGLEYDEVYLFGLRTKDGEDASIKLERMLGFDVTAQKIEEISRAPYRKQLMFTKQLKRLANSQINRLLKEVPINDLLTNSMFTEKIAQILRVRFEMIEEERRLIYVGMTRAKTKLHLDSFIEMTPLLNRVIHN